MKNSQGVNKLRRMKVMVIPIVNGALGTVTKGLVLRLEDLEIRGYYRIIETGQNTEESPGDLRIFDSLSDPSEKPSANASVKNSQKRIIIMLIN